MVNFRPKNSKGTVCNFLNQISNTDMRTKSFDTSCFSLSNHMLPASSDRAEQRLRMCKGCGGLGSKICMGLLLEVNIFDEVSGPGKNGS